MSREPGTTAAKARAEAIRSGIDSIAAAFQEVPRLIIEAREAGDWRTLGYPSWQDYVTGEFGTSIIRLDRATRKGWAITLSQAGMSTREIAPVVNASFKTVARDLETVSNDTVNFRVMPRLRWRQDGSRLSLDLGEYRAAVRELAGIYPEDIQPLITDLYESVLQGIYALGSNPGDGKPYTLSLDKFNEMSDGRIQEAVSRLGKILRKIAEG